MIYWAVVPGRSPSCLGFLPEIVRSDDPRPAKEQFNERYQGGWRIFTGASLDLDNMEPVTRLPKLVYPGDPPLDLIAMGIREDELVLLFPCSWVAILQSDRSYEIARID